MQFSDRSSAGVWALAMVFWLSEFADGDYLSSCLTYLRLPRRDIAGLQPTAPTMPTINSQNEQSTFFQYCVCFANPYTKY